jgi:DNA polymerase-3 subunit beta
MKIECVQDKLKLLLSQADKIAGKNLSLPVLSCFYIIAEKGQLTVRATNLDIGFQSSISAKVDEEGAAAVPANILSSFIANIQSEKSIKLVSDGTTFSVNSLQNRTTIKCLPHDDFPTIPEPPESQGFEIDPKEFVKGLKSVWYSSSISSIKPELASVYIYSDDGEIVFVATDSFRLAEKRIKTKSNKEFDRVLIPFKNVAEIIRVLEQAAGSVMVYLNKNQIAFTFGATRLTSRVIDGTFPDYRQIIPKEFKTEAVILKEDLAQCMKIANIFSDSFNQISMVITPKEKKFELTTKNNTLGENTSLLSGALSGEPAESSFNYRYINDCLQSITADSVSLSLAGAGRPVVIKGVSDKSFTYLVMPMNR